MSYINSMLMKDEKILYRTRPHWIIFTPVFLWLLITVLLCWYGPQYEITRFDFGISYPIYKIVAWVTIIMAALTAISTLTTFLTSEYGITNKRVLMKAGFIRRITLEIMVSKIESIKINQTVIGRICDYGAITISGVGGSQDPIYRLPKPMVFRRMIQIEIDKEHTGTYDTRVRKEPELGL